MWARDGRELFYLEGNKLMAVAVDAKTVFNFTPPTLLFEYRYWRDTHPPHADVDAGGPHYREIKGAGGRRPRIVVTWWAEHEGGEGN